MALIELTDVTKRYGDTVALSDLDLTVRQGSIYGFLGPNGAGKTTTIDLLLDFARPTAGSVRVFGMDPQRESLSIRERTGILPEEFDLYDRLTGRQHLEFAIESKDAADDPDAILERVGLSDAGDQKVGGYSKGMAKRLAFGATLIGDPDLLILDEPSTGLDPAGARDLRTIIREERDRGATVFFSSHILDQVDAVCDRVGILRDGALVAEDTIEGLRQATSAETTLRVTVDKVPDNARQELLRHTGVSEVTIEDTTLVVSCESDLKTTVLDALEADGATVEDFITEESSLEELFMAYTEGTEGVHG